MPALIAIHSHSLALNEYSLPSIKACCKPAHNFRAYNIEINDYLHEINDSLIAINDDLVGLNERLLVTNIGWQVTRH